MGLPNGLFCLAKQPISQDETAHPERQRKMCGRVGASALGGGAWFSVAW